MRDIKAHIKGINVHLDDLKAWKKVLDSQFGHLASCIPRASGSLQGKTKENPRGHIAVMDLRSGKKLLDSAKKKKEAMPDGTSIQRGTSSENVFVPDGTISVLDGIL